MARNDSRRSAPSAPRRGRDEAPRSSALGRLFRRLIGETIRARGNALVIDSENTAIMATQTLRGTLIDMGYDAPTASVVVRFDAVKIADGGALATRRFEAREPGRVQHVPHLARRARLVVADAGVDQDALAAARHLHRQHRVAHRQQRAGRQRFRPIGRG